MGQALSQGSRKLESGIVLIQVPMRFKRRGGRKALVIPPEGGSRASSAGPDDPLASAVARAHLWLRWLETGRFRSISALARAEGVDEAYVRRLLGLTALAPAIVEAILAGREPSGLSIRSLLRTPSDWKAQYRAFGLAEGGGNLLGKSGTGDKLVLATVEGGIGVARVPLSDGESYKRPGSFFEQIDQK